MGGGRDFAGNAIYKRRNGIYERLDGKPINHRASAFETFTISNKFQVLPKPKAVSPSILASMNPLPQNGREAAKFFQTTMALDDLNDKTSGSYISKKKRTDENLYQKLISGEFDTQNGGLLFQSERDKNYAYMKYNDMPSYEDVLAQVVPQITPQNLRQVIPSGLITTIDGKSESPNLWVYETWVTNNNGERVRTYVKIMPMHSNSGKPYTILVSLHRGSRIRNTATKAQKGI